MRTTSFSLQKKIQSPGKKLIPFASGGEADIFGPLSLEQVQTIVTYLKEFTPVSWFDLPKVSSRFILRVGKVNDMEPIHAAEYRKLHHQIVNGSIIMPLLACTVDFRWLDNSNPFLQFPDNRKRNVEHRYRVEIQEYGGEDFFHLFVNPRLVFTFEQIVEMWQSIYFIYMTVWKIIHKMDLYMTDIKVENMVWDGHRLRIIDTHFYPLPGTKPSAKYVTITPRMDMLPLQFFDDPWPKTKHIISVFRQSSQSIMKRREFRKHIDASYEKFKTLVVEETVKERLQRHALLFVMYPILIYFQVLLDQTDRIHLDNEQQKEYLETLQQFCTTLLVERASTISKNTKLMTQFTRPPGKHNVSLSIKTKTI